MSQLKSGRNVLKTVGNLLLPVVFFSIIGSALLCRVWLHQRIVTLGYEVSDLTSQRHSLLLSRTALEREIAEQSDLDRLKTAASVIHHMESPRADQIIRSEEKARKQAGDDGAKITNGSGVP